MPLKFYPIHRTHRVMIAFWVGIAALACLLALIKVPNARADEILPTERAGTIANRAAQITLCQDVTTIPGAECEALILLYEATDGDNWITKTNWLSVTSAITPCDWSGVLCQNDHVVQLSLARNRLTGTLPRALAHLSNLTHLDVAGNRLRGTIPKDVCTIVNTVSFINFGYNALQAASRKTAECLNQIDSDWLQTQTIPPADLRPTAFFSAAVRLAWTPIAYRGDGGGYEIHYSTAITGPYTLHGTTADKNVDTYLLDTLQPGQTYYIRLNTLTPAHDGQPNELRSEFAKTVAVTPPAAGDPNDGTTLLIAYFPADNDLAAQIRMVVERYRVGTSLNPNVQALLLVDGRQENDTTVLHIARGIVTLTDAVQREWAQGELDTSDPAVLSWFLTYARENYPAARVIVSLMGHGVGLVPELDWASASSGLLAASTLSDKLPPLPREWEETPSDITDGTYMSTTDLGIALMTATNNGSNPFDIVFFDQCFEGNLDTLYEVHKTAKVFIASPNYAWLAAAYDKYMTQMTPSATLEEIAQSIINLYQGTLNNQHPNAIFWLRGADIPVIAEAVSTMGDALAAATRASQNSRIAEAVKRAQYADTTQCQRGRLELGPPDELIGAGSLAANLEVAFRGNDPFGVHQAAQGVLTALERVSGNYRIGHPYIARDETWAYTDTLTILTPLPREINAATAWRASIYREDVPFLARWSADPTQSVTVTTAYAFVRDGRWDEFLTEWYAEPLTPTVGQWCHYTPPLVVLSETVEALTVTVTSLEDGVQLDWTPAEEADASEYQIYAQGPYNVRWVLRESLPPTQTTVTVFGLVPETTYQFAIGAVDDEGITFARTEELEFTTPPAEKKVFLPIVRR